MSPWGVPYDALRKAQYTSYQMAIDTRAIFIYGIRNSRH